MVEALRVQRVAGADGAWGVKMRRDDEFFRSMLLNFEASDESLFIVGGTLSMDEDERKSDFHVRLACDAGLMLEMNPSVYRLTSQGHDYLDAVRSDTVWMKTKKGAAEVGGLTLGLMKDLALAYVKQEAAEKLGIKL